MVKSTNRKASELLEKAQLKAAETTKQAEQNAARLIESTQQQTIEMLEKAKQEALEIKNQAKQEGFQAGHAEGAVSAQQEYETRLAQALVLVGKSEEERLTRIRSSEPELLKLAVAIAEKIIGAELKTSPEILVEIVKQALTGIPTAGSIIIKVNAGDYQLIETNLPEIQKVFSDPVPVKIQQDQGVNAGNCYIETDHGNVDARIKTQLEMIMLEILKAGRLE